MYRAFVTVHIQEIALVSGTGKRGMHVETCQEDSAVSPRLAWP